MSYRIVGVGEVLWDLLPSGPQLGGAPANFVHHAAALGADAALVSAVGDDALGQEILARLATWGVDASGVAVLEGRPTGTVSVALDSAGVPKYTIVEGVAWDHVPWLPALERLAAQAELVCFGSLAQRAPESRATIRRFLNALRPETLTLLDINLRPTGPESATLEESLQRADILKLNDDELPIVTQMFGVKGLDGLRERFDLKLIALTRGSQGSVLLSAEERIEHPGFSVEIVDTVGAGDAFTAALALGVLRDDPLEAVAEAANRRAALVCARAGATL